MSESKPYFYETEVEWKGEKDLKLSQPQAARDRRRSAAGIQGARRKLVAGASFRRFAKQLLYAYSARDRGILESFCG